MSILSDENNDPSVNICNSILSSSNNFEDYEIEKTNPHISNYSIIEDKIVFIMCPKCGQIPKITFNTLKFVNILCECNYIKNTYIDNLQDYFIKFSSKKIKINNYTCIYHPHKKFRYYCSDCQANICKYCKTKDDRHKTHTCIRLIDLREKYKIIEDNIKKMDNIQNFRDIINSLENTYNNNPNYNLYETFDNLYKLICSPEEKNKDLNMIIKVKNELKIKSSKALMENIHNIEKITIIEIIRQNLYNINELCKLKFTQLKILNLSENNIQDISPLKNLFSPNLEVLNLLKNKIDDKNIEHIKNFKFPKLISLVLFHNYFKDYTIFEAITKFPNLKTLYIGSNNFNKNIKHLNLNEIKYEFNNLVNIGLINGVFSDDSIKLLSCFHFPKLKNIYLSGNNLSSLSFLNQLICPELYQIWLKDNRIKEFSILTKFKALKRINLENNLIDKIEYLIQFIEEVKIEKILLSNNKIDLTNEKNKRLIHEIKKKIHLDLNYS